MNIQSKETTLLGGRVRLMQPKEGLRAGLDAVFLAASVPIKPNQKGLDLGCGVGSVGLCVLSREPKAHITGIEIQDSLADLGFENIALNDVKNNYELITSDFRNVESLDNQFDHVFINPPFLDAGTYLESPVEIRNKAIGNQTCDDAPLEAWIDFGFNALKSKGVITVIHRTDATQRILNALGKKFGAVEIIPLWPKTGQASKRVIIRAVKHRKSPTTIHAGIVLHDEDGGYTQAAQNILKEGDGLVLV